MTVLQEFYVPNYRSKLYPPSILIWGGNSAHVQKLKETLENNGCEVYCLETDSDEMMAVRQRHFDLIVLDVTGQAEGGVALYKKLEPNLELLDAPVVLLRSTDDATKDVTAGESDLSLPVYHISEISSMLLPIIEQVHYMTYRYR